MSLVAKLEGQESNANVLSLSFQISPQGWISHGLKVSGHPK